MALVQAEVGSPKTAGQLLPQHRRDASLFQHLDELLEAGADRDAEVADEQVGDVRGVVPLPARQPCQDGLSEVVQRSHHSKSCLSVSCSYISTMNRFAAVVRGPSSLVPKLNLGSATTYRKARSTLASSSA